MTEFGPIDAERLTWPRFLEDVAERFGDREALVFHDERLDYAGLHAQARAAAANRAD